MMPTARRDRQAPDGEDPSDGTRGRAMRMMMMLVFFTLFLAVLGLISWYLFIRGLAAIPRGSALRRPYIVLFWFLTLSFVGGRVFENLLPSAPATILIWIGSFWLGAVVYLLIAALCVDLLRLVHRFLPFFPAAVTRDLARAKLATLATVLAATALCLAGGYVNSLFPVVRTLDIEVARRCGGMESLDIVAASDIHLGTIVGRARLDGIVDRINRLHPDIVLLPGDIVDEDLAPVIRQNLGAAIENIRSRFGTYAVTGNHEYIGGVEEAAAYLRAHGVILLRDEKVRIGDAFHLVGREDRSIGRFTGLRRKGLDALMDGIDDGCPVILLDHQPFELEEAARHGVTLQLSGHTHYGQLWPLHLVVRMMYEVPWGYKRSGDTHYYVSSGVGTWGPPMRIGNRPEIVHIRLRFP
jgi:predicted MPP superfamily phosphohydrolase